MPGLATRRPSKRPPPPRRAPRRAAFSLLLLAACAAPPPEPTDALQFRLGPVGERLWVGATEVHGLRIEAWQNGAPARAVSGTITLTGLGPTRTATLHAGRAELPPVDLEDDAFDVAGLGAATRIELPVMPGWLALAPALLAVALALLLRDVLIALAGGIFAGFLSLSLYDPARPRAALLDAGTRSLDALLKVAADPDHVRIIVFTLLMGAMVSVVARSGGTHGVVQWVARRAQSARSGMLATWAMGLVVFFDDYTSALLIGTTMRPITDRLRVSREKLAYIVDSTSAPIASLALVSTWIGYEVSVLGDELKHAGLALDAYDVFVRGLPSRFYPVLALGFVGLNAWLGRDFGPMLAAERRARQTGAVLGPDARPLMGSEVDMEAPPKVARARLAVVPLATLVGTVLAVLGATGFAGAVASSAWPAAKASGLLRMAGLILSEAQAYDALVYGSAASLLAAWLFALGHRALSLRAASEAIVAGTKSMMLAVIILCLAWTIGHVMGALGAGAFVASGISDALPAWSLGGITFLLASFIAFATGTSWGTIAILFPIVVPVAATFQGSPAFDPVLLGTTSAVLAGAVFGDHCSPISDTTVLSSMASASDHLDHTKTQAPYALVVGAVALVVGCLPYGFGVPAAPLLAIGLAALFLVLRFVGRRPDST